MYKQLTSEQRSQIFALLQRKSPRKEIARIVGISESTFSRELKRNSTSSGKYIGFKAHDKAMTRRKRTVRNARLAPELVWRIKQLILRLLHNQAHFGLSIFSVIFAYSFLIFAFFDLYIELLFSPISIVKSIEIGEILLI